MLSQISLKKSITLVSLFALGASQAFAVSVDSHTYNMVQDGNAVVFQNDQNAFVLVRNSDSGVPSDIRAEKAALIAKKAVKWAVIGGTTVAVILGSSYATKFLHNRHYALQYAKNEKPKANVKIDDAQKEALKKSKEELNKLKVELENLSDKGVDIASFDEDGNIVATKLDDALENEIAAKKAEYEDKKAVHDTTFKVAYNAENAKARNAEFKEDYKAYTEKKNEIKKARLSSRKSIDRFFAYANPAAIASAIIAAFAGQHDILTTEEDFAGKVAQVVESAENGKLLSISVDAEQFDETVRQIKAKGLATVVRSSQLTAK